MPIRVTGTRTHKPRATTGLLPASQQPPAAHLQRAFLRCQLGWKNTPVLLQSHPRAHRLLRESLSAPTAAAALALGWLQRRDGPKERGQPPARTRRQARRAVLLSQRAGLGGGRRPTKAPSAGRQRRGGWRFSSPPKPLTVEEMPGPTLLERQPFLWVSRLQPGHFSRALSSE